VPSRTFDLPIRVRRPMPRAAATLPTIVPQKPLAAQRAKRRLFCGRPQPRMMGVVRFPIPISPFPGPSAFKGPTSCSLRWPRPDIMAPGSWPRHPGPIFFFFLPVFLFFFGVAAGGGVAWITVPVPVGTPRNLSFRQLAKQPSGRERICHARETGPGIGLANRQARRRG